MIGSELRLLILEPQNMGRTGCKYAFPHPQPFPQGEATVYTQVEPILPSPLKPLAFRLIKEICVHRNQGEGSENSIPSPLGRG